MRWKRRRPGDEEFGHEIRTHLQLEADRLMADGMAPEEARATARRAFGNVALTRERFYESRRLLWLDHLRQDVHYALRSFGRNPGFSLAALLTLALGIGANTAIFSVVNAVLLRPLPYDEADRLVDIAGALPFPGMTQSEVAAIQARSRALTHIGVYFPVPTARTLTGRADPVRVEGIQVMPTILEMVSARPLIGRIFAAHEDSGDAARVIVLSYATWQRHFGGDREIVGRTIALDGVGHQVVGVMPPAFKFPDARTEFWVPLVWPQRARLVPSARLRDGVSLDAARTEISAIVQELRAGAADAGVGPPPPASPPGAPQGVVLTRKLDLLVAPVKPALVALAAAVMFVLLIACVNVANLLLARTVSRQREIAVRHALGAGRGRLMRQVFTESVVLSLIGGTAGIGLAFGGVGLLRALAAGLPRDVGLGGGIPRFEDIGIDGRVLVFSALLSVATGLLFGLAPALTLSRAGRTEALRQNSTVESASFNLFGRHRLLGLLVAGETAMAMVLLVSGGLLIRSFVKLSSVDPGYDTANVLTFQVAWPRDRYASTLPEDVLERVRSVPGVGAAGYAQTLPMIYEMITVSVTLSTTPRLDNQMPPPPPPPTGVRPPQFPEARLVSRDYLRVMNIPVVEGRGFEEGDNLTGARVMLINRALARSGFLGEHPLGSQIYPFGNAEPCQIVGIVEDTRKFLNVPPGPEVYFDQRQIRRPATLPTGQRPLPYFAVRFAGRSDAVLASIRDVVRQFHPEATVERVARMEELVSNSVARPRLYAALAGLFAAVAVALSAVGIYGVMAYSITQRTREIGIRVALGARRSQVIGLVVRQGLILAAIGLVMGIAGAAMVTRYLDTMLFGLTPLDAATFVAVGALFAAVAAAAAFVPARRATRVDPLVALRCE